MAFHIPFNQRNRRPPVVYIGFGRADRPRRKFNWWGFNGLWMSMGAFFTVGALSPVALMVSMRGLRQKPRKMAVAGTVLSLVGTAMFAALMIGVVSDKANRRHLAKLRLQDRIHQTQIVESEALIGEAVSELVEYREGHDGELPSWIDGNMLLLKHVDPWGNSLRFDAEEGHVVIRSAGPDKVYDTGDDVTVEVIGETDREVLIGL